MNMLFLYFSYAININGLVKYPSLYVILYTISLQKANKYWYKISTN